MTKEELFFRLASAQRGEPEELMRRIQDTQVSQLYGSLAEHVGDLTHRMAEYPEHPGYYNGYPYVKEKVDKTLRWLRRPYGFSQEVKDQAVSNYEYYRNHKTVSLPRFYTSPQAGLDYLQRLGKIYADAHRELPVVNEVQTVARDAAIAVGEFRFYDAQRKLEMLEDLLEKGPEAWAAEAGKVQV